MYSSFRLLTFETEDVMSTSVGDDDSNQTTFIIKMFGINEKGKTVCIYVTDYTPFFYVKVGDKWTETEKVQFVSHICSLLGEQYADAIHSTKLIKRKKLYGFDAGKQYNFIHFKFKNETAMKKTKGLWYNKANPKGEYRLDPEGLLFEDEQTKLYEAQIPPLLRLFHIKEFSPSGWIGLPCNKRKKVISKKSTCDFEYSIKYTDIIPLPNKETIVPYKICSFDIEASSSHGDFPLPNKNYKKLATNIIDVCKATNTYNEEFLKSIVLTAFGFGYDENGTDAKQKVEDVDIVYPIRPVTQNSVEHYFQTWIKIKPANYKDKLDMDTVDSGLTNIKYDTTKETNGGDDANEGDNDNDTTKDDDDDDNLSSMPIVEEVKEYGGDWRLGTKTKSKMYKKKGTILDLLLDDEVMRDTKLLELTRTMTDVFPQLQGDNVTFIGSTFVKYGEDKPYLNHCIVKDTCAPVNNAVIESYKTEKEVLLAWTALIQRENPDIIIGYNIFGFDYQFMYLRAKELGCDYEFSEIIP